MPQTHLIKRMAVYGTIVFVCFLGLIFFSFFYGEPIHDINVWVLEKSFYAKDISHPDNSVLLEKKKYLGGVSLHGGHRCVYAVGEARTAPLSKDEIRRIYQDTTLRYWSKKLPLKILFVDEYGGPYTMPYVNWQDDIMSLSKLSETENDTHYIVYVAVERPIILFDYRCDD